MIKDDKNLDGPYILWLRNEYGFVPTSFPTIKDALEAERYTIDFVITKLMEYEVNELVRTTETAVNYEKDQMKINWEKTSEEREKE